MIQGYGIETLERSLGKTDTVPEILELSRNVGYLQACSLFFIDISDEAVTRKCNNMHDNHSF